MWKLMTWESTSIRRKKRLNFTGSSTIIMEKMMVWILRGMEPLEEIMNLTNCSV